MHCVARGCGILLTFIAAFALLCYHVSADAAESPAYVLAFRRLIIDPLRLTGEFLYPAQVSLFGDNPDVARLQQRVLELLDNATLVLEAAFRAHTGFAQTVLDREVEGVTSGATTPSHAEALQSLLSMITAIIQAELQQQQNAIRTPVTPEPTPFDHTPQQKPVYIVAGSSPAPASPMELDASVTPYSSSIGPPTADAHSFYDRPLLRRTALPLDQRSAWRSIRLFAAGLSAAFAHVPTDEEDKLNGQFLYALLQTRFPYTPEVFAGLALDTLSFVNATQGLQCPPPTAFHVDALATMFLFRLSDTPEAFASVMLDFFRISCASFALTHQPSSEGAAASSPYRLPLTRLSAPSLVSSLHAAASALTKKDREQDEQVHPGDDGHQMGIRALQADAAETLRVYVERGLDPLTVFGTTASELLHETDVTQNHARQMGTSLGPPEPKNDDAHVVGSPLPPVFRGTQREIRPPPLQPAHETQHSMASPPAPHGGEPIEVEESQSTMVW